MECDAVHGTGQMPRGMDGCLGRLRMAIIDFSSLD